VYVPEPEIPFYRVGAYSNFSRLMAPTAKASLYVELASKTPPTLGQVLPEVADALTQMGIIRGRDAIRFARLRRIPNAYVLYDARREQALNVLHSFLSQHRIHSVGRYGAWEYSSMEDALFAGQCAAQALLAEGAT
jgi:protoporphyrinogen oxidase